jgi:hypothetical protein
MDIAASEVVAVFGSVRHPQADSTPMVASEAQATGCER